jgi:hypothetical protein
VELLHGAERLLLGPGTALKLTRRRLKSTLELAGRQVSLSRAALQQALEFVCVARLAPRPAVWIPSPFVRPGSFTNAALLAHLLSPDETLLAWYPLAEKLTGQSALLGQWTAPAWLLLTEQRALCVAVSEVGEVEYLAWQEAPPASAPSALSRGLAKLNRGEPALPNAELLTPAREPTGEARILEVARACVRLGNGSAKVTALKLLACPALATDPTASLMRAWLDLEDSPGRVGRAAQSDLLSEVALSALAQADLPRLHTHWQISITASRRLLGVLPRDPRYSSAASALSRTLWEAERASSQGPAAAAEADIAHAALLLDYEQVAAATALLSTRRAQLPPMQLGDIELPIELPPSPLRGTRQRLERLTLRAQVDNPHGRTKVLQRLNELDPLNPEWLVSLAECGEEPVATRARVALQVVHGLGDAEPPAAALNAGTLTPLPSEYFQLLPHPLISPHKQALTRVQTLLAKVPTPDFSTLKLYCERVTKADLPVVIATDEAATLLGLGHLETYVSRGRDDVGCRAFNHQSPFVLVGGQHLDPESRYYMPIAQLRFVIGSELAHLRFGHVRVAPRDVLSGVLDKSKQGLDLALGILPILKGLKLANHLGVLAAKLSLPQAITAARALTHAVDKAQPASDGRADISTANEELLLAHRLMQLSADRVGLLACQSFPAAVAALFRSRSDYVRGAAELAARGALPVIEKQRGGHPEAYADLLTRLGALTSFYLSDTYALLVGSVYQS